MTIKYSSCLLCLTISVHTFKRVKNQIVLLVLDQLQFRAQPSKLWKIFSKNIAMAIAYQHSRPNDSRFKRYIEQVITKWNPAKSDKRCQEIRKKDKKTMVRQRY